MTKLALTLPGGRIIEDPLEEKGLINIGDIINALLPSVFVIAGLALFFYLIWGGFDLLTSIGDPEKVKSARGKITNAIVGFVIIFIAYWLIQILETIFGLKIF